LADEKRKVEELESRGVGPADDDELGQELATSREEIKTLNKVILLTLFSNSRKSKTSSLRWNNFDPHPRKLKTIYRS
jgi:hypothetical protein